MGFRRAFTANAPSNGEKFNEVLSAFFFVSLRYTTKNALRTKNRFESVFLTEQILTFPDRAADSKKLRERLMKERGIDLICSHRSTCKYRTQDGRKLRRYSRRWIIERTNAWLQNFRRIVVRYDRFISSYHSFVTLASIMICLKRL